jgi:hypothetical protein
VGVASESAVAERMRLAFELAELAEAMFRRLGRRQGVLEAFVRDEREPKT